jgi:hypothetical protein
MTPGNSECRGTERQGGVFILTCVLLGFRLIGGLVLAILSAIL